MQQVVGVVRACDKGRACVEIGQSGCGRCSEPGGCGGVSIAQSLCSSKKQFWLADTLGLEPGDRVVVALPDKALARTATAAYVVPLALGLAAAGVAHVLFGDPGSPLIDLTGFVAGLAGGWVWLARLKPGATALPVLLARNG